MITPSVSAFTGASRTHVPFIRFFFFFRSSIAFHRLPGISPRYFLQNPLKCCTVNDISDTVFRKWLKQYDEGGLEALVRADAEIKEVLPEGVDRTKEFYKREILRLCIENERLKKLCGADEQGWANGVCLFKNEEFKIVDMLSRDFAITDITHGYRWVAAFIRNELRATVSDNFVYKCFRYLGIQSETHPCFAIGYDTPVNYHLIS